MNNNKTIIVDDEFLYNIVIDRVVAYLHQFANDDDDSREQSLTHDDVRSMIVSKHIHALRSTCDTRTIVSIAFYDDSCSFFAIASFDDFNELLFCEYDVEGESCRI